MNQPTPAPLPGGELGTSTRREAPLLGGAGGGFMAPIHGQILEVFPTHEPRLGAPASLPASFRFDVDFAGKDAGAPRFMAPIHI